MSTSAKIPDKRELENHPLDNDITMILQYPER